MNHSILPIDSSSRSVGTVAFALHTDTILKTELTDNYLINSGSQSKPPLQSQLQSLAQWKGLSSLQKLLNRQLNHQSLEFIHKLSYLEPHIHSHRLCRLWGSHKWGSLRYCTGCMSDSHRGSSCWSHHIESSRLVQNKSSSQHIIHRWKCWSSSRSCQKCSSCS